MANMDNPSEWKEAIPHIQSQINTKSASSNLSPNEIVKEFTPNNTSDILSRRPRDLLDKPKARLAVHDALAIAAIPVKHQYDRRHTTKVMAVGDQDYVRLDQG